MASVTDSVTATAGPDITRPRASRREDLLTMVFATWLIVGIFVDGWAHNNDKPETFFTPWHAMFYSGFLATAVWMTWTVQRRRAEGATGPAAVPVGYGLGLAGVAVFAVGGVFDLVWHQIFGIEVDLEALLSPSHLVLFCGALLVVTSPLRSAWNDPASRAPGFGQFLPALLSTTLCTAMVAFMFMVFSPFLTGAMTDGPYRFAAFAIGDSNLAGWFVEELQLEGYAAIMLTTLILLAPALLLMRRWTLPFGTFTFLLGAVGTLSAGIESFDFGPAFLAPAIAGLVGDLLYRRLRPSPERPWSMRAWAAAVPAVMWLAYFALLAAFRTVGWSVELWSGVVAMSAMAGFALALCVAPPPVPAESAVAEPA
ncbi:MAG: hypothetical protein QOD63_2068 [Actinomycetota bacterium]|jgi:hypothetical protein|nr:hypothetical protein [Actinomycetota bacterium]